MEFEQSYKMNDWLRQHFFYHTRQSSKKRTLKTKIYRCVNQCLTTQGASAVRTIAKAFKLQVHYFKRIKLELLPNKTLEMIIKLFS